MIVAKVVLWGIAALLFGASLLTVMGGVFNWRFVVYERWNAALLSALGERGVRTACVIVGTLQAALIAFVAFKILAPMR